jgi:hypothetical protein
MYRIALIAFATAISSPAFAEGVSLSLQAERIVTSPQEGMAYIFGPYLEASSDFYGSRTITLAADTEYYAQTRDLKFWCVAFGFQEQGDGLYGTEVASLDEGEIYARIHTSSPLQVAVTQFQSEQPTTVARIQRLACKTAGPAIRE